MAGFIGNKPGAKYATLTRQTFSTPTGTSHVLSHTVTNSDDLLLYINNVKQNPADYTASGTTLTTASLAGGTEMYCLYYGKTTETVAVPASSVGDSHMVDMAASKLTGALPAISGASLTNLNGSNIASGTVADARISALTASKLTGALPAISGASLTSLPATLMVSKVVEFGFDMGTTGTLAITGVGFQPTCIIACTVSNSDGMATWCYVDDNGTDNCRYRLDSASVDQFSWEARYYNLVFAAHRRAYADFTSFDSDGFTMTRYRDGSDSGTVGCLALCLR